MHKAIESGLMYTDIEKRDGVTTTINGKDVVNYCNCSYLGFDTDPSVIAAGKKVLDDYGTNFVAARTRLTISPLTNLEAKLSDFYGAGVITFPSLSITHFNILPLLASGMLWDEVIAQKEKVFIFDRFAHASMKVMKPFIKDYAEVKEIQHNDMNALEEEIRSAASNDKIVVYLCDSIYSMGGVAPLEKLKVLLEHQNFYLYIDDAHGTSIFGEKGEGYVLSRMNLNTIPSNLYIQFSLTKGFGCNGGGIIIADDQARKNIRTLGQTYQFSGGMDFSAIGSTLEVLERMETQDIKIRQKKLWDNVKHFDSLLHTDHINTTSPIRMIMIGNEEECIDSGYYLLQKGHYVSTAFFPVVPRDKAQLRICITAGHTKDQLSQLVEDINNWQNRTSYDRAS